MNRDKFGDWLLVLGERYPAATDFITQHGVSNAWFDSLEGVSLEDATKAVRQGFWSGLRSTEAIQRDHSSCPGIHSQTCVDDLIGRPSWWYSRFRHAGHVRLPVLPRYRIQSGGQSTSGHQSNHHSARGSTASNLILLCGMRLRQRSSAIASQSKQAFARLRSVSHVPKWIP